MKKGRNLIKRMAFLLAMILTVSAVVPEMMPTAKVEAASVKLSHKGITLTRGQRYTLKVTGTKKKVSWKSSNSRIATVDKKGTVKGLREGSAVITAKVGKKKLTCKVAVRGYYKTIYKALLTKGTITVKSGNYNYTRTIQGFVLLDIDKNGVPELIIKDTDASSAYASYYVYTVRSGKLRYCGEYVVRGQSQVFYNSKYKALYMSWWTNSVGGVGHRLIRLSGTELKDYKYLWTGSESPYSTKQIYQYGTTGDKAKNVSKSTFNSKYKKYFKSYKKYNFVPNTEYNIKKYFK